MKQTIDFEHWKRKNLFLHFSGFDDPYFGITTTVDCTHLYHKVKAQKSSFFLCSLHKILQAANSTEEFRYRIEEGEIVCYDSINASPTIGREDETFGFGFFSFSEELEQFLADAHKEIERVKTSTELFPPEKDARRIDTIYYSSVPWFSFTDMKHPANIPHPSSIPQISVGKLQDENGILKLPISISVHHGLMDGLHVAKFLTKLQALVNE